MAHTTRQRVREDPIVRRQQIVDEAVRVIGQHGYNGFTIQRLAAKCGLSNAGLLYYFGSKNALLVEVLDVVGQRETAVLAPLVATIRRSSAVRAELLIDRTRLLRRLLERFVEQPELGRFLSTLESEALDQTHPAFTWFRERHAEALGLFEMLMTGAVPHPQMTARLLFAMMNGLWRHWLHDDPAFDVLAAWDEGIAALVGSSVNATYMEKSSEGEGV